VIPRRLIRVVPEKTTDEVEEWWLGALKLHPGWGHVTRRDPIDPSRFPLTSPHWDKACSGAQLADLVRAEELYQRGGIYLDSDIEVYRSFEPLMNVAGFAGWEDEQHIPNFVMGFQPRHPAIEAVVHGAIEHMSEGTWAGSVGVTTAVFKDRTDMLLLPPQSFAPYHYRIKKFVDTDQVRRDNPWAFCAHHWRHSWAGEG
jgi:hypothetical protein